MKLLGFGANKRFKSAVVWTTVAACLAGSSLNPAYAETDRLAGNLGSIEEKFSAELALYEDLNFYTKQLKERASMNERAKTGLLSSIKEAADYPAKIEPLMAKMVNSIELLVNNDLPFHHAQRKQSVAELKTMLLDPEASLSDRYKNIMDIYMIELEYGKSVEAYPDKIELDGAEVNVNILRIGRMALYYLRKDGSQAGIWDAKNNKWETIADQYIRTLQRAMKVADKKVAPALIQVPLTVPARG